MEDEKIPKKNPKTLLLEEKIKTIGTLRDKTLLTIAEMIVPPLQDLIDLIILVEIIVVVIIVVDLHLAAEDLHQVEGEHLVVEGEDN